MAFLRQHMQPGFDCWNLGIYLDCGYLDFANGSQDMYLCKIELWTYYVVSI